MEAVWPDSIVEENNLTQNISTLRRMFGETPGAHQFIVTVPGRGYRFVAEVKALTGANADERSHEAPPLLPPVPPPPSHPRAPHRYRLVIAAIVAVAVIGGVSFSLRQRRPPGSATPPSAARAEHTVAPEKSIAVLPFENLSADPENAYFATGIQDEILSNLAKIADLKVISRTSANLYKTGSPRNAREIGEQLGVARLLEGSVQRAGDRVRINAQLIDARTDAHLWAQSYDRSLADVFAIQAEIAQTIAGQLRAQISPEEKAAIAHPPTTDLAANALYARAMAIRSESSDMRAQFDEVRFLDQAVSHDPRFVLAYCALAQAHLNIFFGGLDHTPARRELANVAITKAEQLQPEAGDVRMARAEYWLHGFRDYDRARAELEMARRTLPNDARVFSWSSILDRRQGRWVEAIRNHRRAIELDPRNVDFMRTAATTYGRLRRYAEEKELYDRALAIAPRDPYSRIQRAAMALDVHADPHPLRAELDAIIAESPAETVSVADQMFYCALVERDPVAADSAVALIPPEGAGGGVFPWPREWYVGLAARTFGHPEAARTAFEATRVVLEKVVGDQPDYHEAWALLARVDAALGRKDEAIAEARRACDLLPLTKDACFGISQLRALAWTYAWVNEPDLAMEQLELLQREGGISYGELKLNPEWDSLRRTPRFEKIVAALAPEKAP